MLDCSLSLLYNFYILKCLIDVLLELLVSGSIYSTMCDTKTNPHLTVGEWVVNFNH